MAKKKIKDFTIGEVLKICKSCHDCPSCPFYNAGCIGYVNEEDFEEEVEVEE